MEVEIGFEVSWIFGLNTLFDLYELTLIIREFSYSREFSLALSYQ